VLFLGVVVLKEIGSGAVDWFDTVWGKYVCVCVCVCVWLWGGETLEHGNKISGFSQNREFLN